MEDGVAFTRLEPGAERVQTLRRQLGVTAFGLNLISLAPGQRGRIHRHERQEEVYVVLAGTLTLLAGGERHELGPHAAVRVAPAVRRQLVNAGSEPVILLAVGGAEPHAGRDGIAYETWEQTDGRPPQELPLPADLAPGEAP